jgi:hypothetical protein
VSEEAFNLSWGFKWVDATRLLIVGGFEVLTHLAGLFRESSENLMEFLISGTVKNQNKT